MRSEERWRGGEEERGRGRGERKTKNYYRKKQEAWMSSAANNGNGDTWSLLMECYLYSEERYILPPYQIFETPPYIPKQN
jgi:hypothetical protein